MTAKKKLKRTQDQVAMPGGMTRNFKHDDDDDKDDVDKDVDDEDDV